MKRDGLSGLYLQKYALVQACARQSQALIAKMQNEGPAESH